MEYLIKARKAKNLTQYDIAKLLNITRTTYAYYEKENSNPPKSILIKLSEILEVSIDYLLTGQEFSQQNNFTQEQLEIAKLLKLMNERQLNKAHGYLLGLLEQNYNYKIN